MDMPNGSPSEVHAPTQGSCYLDVSPNASRAVYTVGRGPSDGELWIMDLATGASTMILGGVGTIIDPTWMPNGSEIAFIAETYETSPSAPVFSIGMVDADGQHLRDVAELPQGGVSLDV